MLTFIFLSYNIYLPVSSSSTPPNTPLPFSAKLLLVHFPLEKSGPHKDFNQPKCE